MKAKVIRLSAPTGRVVAVSDVHGNLAYLRGLLEKIRFGAGDTLVIVGDLLEKGPDSLGTLRYVIELAKTNTVHWIEGNCDTTYEYMVDPEHAEHMKWWNMRSPHRIIREMCDASNIPVDDQTDFTALIHRLIALYPVEFEYMKALPTILVLGEYIFVHGGITNEPLEDQDKFACQKNDNFMSKNFAFDQYVVVGHWPVVLYNAQIPQSNPVIDHTRKIISIDGGCVLKLDAQLNALIIPDASKEVFFCDCYDDYPQVQACEDQNVQGQSSLNICWMDNKITVLGTDKEFSLCRHEATGKEIYVLTECIFERDGSKRTADATDFLLDVKKGDTLSAICETSRGLLAKMGGVTGWYKGAYKKA